MESLHEEIYNLKQKELRNNREESRKKINKTDNAAAAKAARVRAARATEAAHGWRRSPRRPLPRRRLRS